LRSTVSSSDHGFFPIPLDVGVDGNDPASLFFFAGRGPSFFVSASGSLFVMLVSAVECNAHAGWKVA
jgi:hypothetical protein